MARYEQLHVWQRSIDLVCEAYRISKALPADERFGLSAQLRRAAVSVPCNIAEGAARYGRKELLRHLSIARGSLKEVETLLIILERLSYIAPTGLSTARGYCEEISKMLYALRKKLTQ
jgi:four helix bundle protein